MNAAIDTLVEPVDEQGFSPRIWIVAGRSTLATGMLVGAFHERGVRAQHVLPARLPAVVRPGDLVLGRLDVRPTLDGVEDGLSVLRAVEQLGIRVLNRPATLLACHDKLQTTLRLTRSGLPHPVTAHVDAGMPARATRLPAVVKPRFGSWGADVFLCESEDELDARLDELRGREWFRRQGVLVQELIPPAGFDLRVIVARGRVVGAIERVAAPGEWRTNVALGGWRRQTTPTREAAALALAAAASLDADLVGVDLLPVSGGGYVVLEVNGAVDFTAEYSVAGRDVFEEVAAVVACEVAGLDATASGSAA